MICSFISVHAGAVPAMTDPALNPWVLPLTYCAERPGAYGVDIDMGFVNTDYACHIDSARGVVFDKQTKQPNDRDAARWMLTAVNQCQQVRHFRLQAGVSRDSESELRALLPLLPQANIHIGQDRGRWSPPETHAKVFQLADPDAGRFFTVHGSLNLQTVGMCCKANNALRFVEYGQGSLYGYFKQLSDAVAADSAESLFGGRGSSDSSGVLPEADIGEYRVAFYAGRAQGFVGAVKNDEALPWPHYLNPPVENRHAPGVVHWYDGVLYEAARQLQQGREVHLDVLMFEIGRESAFINHLWRFVQEGFGGDASVESDGTVNSAIMGRLQVRFLWQFQSHPDLASETTVNLNTLSAIETPGLQGGYHLQTGRIWPKFDGQGKSVPPTTPYDMHNKVVVMSVPNHMEENRIFVASSNLDTPGVGSGRLWQVGTVVRDRRPQPEPSADGPASLFQAYQDYFELLWRNRQGQSDAGQISFYEELARRHRVGRVNWIETQPSEARNAMSLKPGIDAFFFPMPTEAP